ncbi:hypothetical protein BDR04DRAFT_1078148 [Suillus decipiens]|nr:hypothetical protein BDR04DRAFT_1078148 [Suillus decipiens]
MGGFMLYVDGKPYLTLRSDDILTLIRDKCIDVPALTAEQIHDKSKGNAISKGLIMLQVAWFVMQLITRAIYHLEITQLEVGTLAFAALNFLTYAVWWNKPLNVQRPHPVYWKSTDSESKPENYIDVYRRGESPLFRPFPVFDAILELMGVPGIPTSRKLRVPTFDGSIGLKDSDKTILKLAGLLMATIFGAIHCMAWFFAFPSYQERVLWRMSAVAITFTPWLCLLTPRIFNLIDKSLSGRYFISISRYLHVPILGVSIILYITARAVLLVLMFTTLRNLPPDAYKEVLWTSLIPHL